MGNYARAAIAAYTMLVKTPVAPRDAWEQAIASVTESISARRKGCPRATFLALAENGYLKGVKASGTPGRVGVLSRRAMDAAVFILSYPHATHKDLSAQLNYVDGQGSYEIVIELAKRGFLRRGGA